MVRVQTTATIDRPPEEIFDHWADGRLYNAWCPGATKRDVRMVTPGPLGAGSRFRGTFKGAGEVEYEFVDYDRPRRLTMVMRPKMGDFRHQIDLEPVPGGTRVTQRGEGQLRGIFRLLGPLLQGTFARSFRANDAALKRYLERGANGDPLARSAHGAEKGA
jgi:uncharacterized protein YndB with AHSA1/START domain